ncbi:MAG: rhodanese-like domain-containing protein [Isosphaeraceae bacterium]
MTTEIIAPDITARELARRLGAGEPLALLDVREPVEREYCAIPVHAAVVDLHIPVSQIVAHLETIVECGESRPIVVYCHHGVRSRMVADWLGQQGVGGLLNLAGGIDAWSHEVDPLLPRY